MKSQHFVAWPSELHIDNNLQNTPMPLREQLIGELLEVWGRRLRAPAR